MKKLLILFIVLCMPLCALAAEPVTLDSSELFAAPGELMSIFDYIILPDGGALLNVHVRNVLDGQGKDNGSYNQLHLMRLEADGTPTWNTCYLSTAFKLDSHRINLALDKDSAILLLYGALREDGTRQQTTMRFDLMTGEYLEDVHVVQQFPEKDVPTFSHCGDFRVEEYFGAADNDVVPTGITYIPTGSRAEYRLSALRYCFAFGDKLLGFSVDMADVGHYWVFDANCQLVSNEQTPFGLSAPFVDLAAVGEDTMYLFVWTNHNASEPRSYTVYPVDKEMRIGEAVMSFTLAEGYALDAAMVCGDGFLLKETLYQNWAPISCDLTWLGLDGSKTVLTSGIPQRSSLVLLLPGEDDDHARVILRDEAGQGLRQWVYAAQ